MTNIHGRHIFQFSYKNIWCANCAYLFTMCELHYPIQFKVIQWHFCTFTTKQHQLNGQTNDHPHMILLVIQHQSMPLYNCHRHKFTNSPTNVSAKKINALNHIKYISIENCLIFALIRGRLCFFCFWMPSEHEFKFLTSIVVYGGTPLLYFEEFKDLFVCYNLHLLSRMYVGCYAWEFKH